jgi:hypothetical protein
MSNYQSQSVSCPSAPSQYGALEGILSCDPDIERTVGVLKGEARCRCSPNWLKFLDVKTSVPEGAFLPVGRREAVPREEVQRAGRAHSSAELCVRCFLRKSWWRLCPAWSLVSRDTCDLSYALDTATRRMEAIKTNR